MRKRNHSGSAAAALMVTVLILALVAVSGFAVWAFASRQDYKNNSDQKADQAAAKAVKDQQVKLQKQFDQQAKNPNKTFRGSSTYGSVTFKYPKTWSAYVDETGSNEPLNGYFYPNQVPGITGATAYALRVELVDSAYEQVLQELDVTNSQGKLSAVAYVPPKMKKKANVQPGTLFTGAIGQGQQGGDINGRELVIKVRDKTLKIYTQSSKFLDDFDHIVLPSLTFVP